MPVAEIIARLELDHSVEDPAVVWRGNVLKVAHYINIIQKIKLKVPVLHSRLDEAVSTREKADIHHDEIMGYCKTCLEG